MSIPCKSTEKQNAKVKTTNKTNGLKVSEANFEIELALWSIDAKSLQYSSTKPIPHAKKKLFDDKGVLTMKNERIDCTIEICL